MPDILRFRKYGISPRSRPLRGLPVYTYTGETPASYIIAAKENGTTIAMAVNGTSVEAQEAFEMKKDEKLTVETLSL